MPIIYNEANKIFKLDTQNTSYIFTVSEYDMLEHLYYGARIDDIDLRSIGNRQVYSFAFSRDEEHREYAISTILSEYSTYNAGDFRSPALVVENFDGTKGTRLLYRSYRIYKGRTIPTGMPHSRESGAEETLMILLADEEKGIEVELYYTVYPKQDVITRFQRIVNTSKKAAYIEKAASLCLDFYGSDFDLIELKGMYLYERASIQRSPLKKGLQGSGSLLGVSSHHENPFFAICSPNANEDVGEVYGFNLLYSGNFLNEIEVDRLSDTRLLAGVHPTGFRWKLEADGSFDTPEAVMTYSNDGIGGMSRNFHDHIRENIVEPDFAYCGRPIVMNSWEGYAFAVTEEKILQLGKEAKKVGADTIVLDDGWFRDSIAVGLGDWKINATRFPNGLKKLANEIHKQDLKFGIWIEPEMVSRFSEYYQKNLECILQTHRDPLVGRNQYVLDLTKAENVRYIFQRIVEELDGVELDYIKWDMNRYITEAASSDTSSGEVYHRQTLGVYKLYDLFKKKYPNILFEGCCGGGGRFDLGMLYYNPQIWASDNTDPYARVYIQYGTSIAYPNSCISCHYTAGECTSGVLSKPNFRYLVASFGSYGYELDLSKLPQGEQEELKAYTEEYKANEHFVLEGDLYRLISPESDKFCAYMQVTKDKNLALFTFLHIHSTGFYENILLKLKGLDERKIYENVATGEKRSGKGWMCVGLRIKDLFKEKSGSGFQLLFRAE